MNPSTASNEGFVRQITQSSLYRAYEKAFRKATGLPLIMVPARGRTASLMRADDPCGSRFCQLLNAGGESPCKQCLRATMDVMRRLPGEVQSLDCFAGLKETMVPVKLGQTVFAYLKTGQVKLATRRSAAFPAIAETLRAEGFSDRRLQEMQAAYDETRILDDEAYQSMVTLLAIFSIQLGNLANQLTLEQHASQPSIVTIAKRYIAENLCEPINLDDVAGQARVSTYYFCKVFKQSTGMTFTQYVNRKRIELAKRELLRPQVPVTTIAYDVGYQSLSQFNRNFLRYVGESPTAYRKRIRQGPARELTVAC